MTFTIHTLHIETEYKKHCIHEIKSNLLHQLIIKIVIQPQRRKIADFKLLRLNKDTGLIGTRKVALTTDTTVIFPRWLIKFDSNPDRQRTTVVVIFVVVLGISGNARERDRRDRANETNSSSADVRWGRGEDDGAF